MQRILITLPKNGDDGTKWEQNGNETDRKKTNGYGKDCQIMDEMISEICNIFDGNGVEYREVTGTDFIQHFHIQNVTNSQVHYFCVRFYHSTSRRIVQHIIQLF